MTDKQYVNALVMGAATIETRSERVLIAEVKRLRAMKDSSDPELVTNLFESRGLAIKERDMAYDENSVLRAELEWFRRRERGPIAEIRGGGDRFEMIVEEWERANSKPTGGE